jgi:hypothetical protein
MNFSQYACWFGELRRESGLIYLLDLLSLFTNMPLFVAVHTVSNIILNITKNQGPPLQLLTFSAFIIEAPNYYQCLVLERTIRHELPLEMMYLERNAKENDV